MQIKRRAWRQAQYRMQHGPVFGRVDGLAGQHRVTPRFELLLPRQRQQARQHRCSDALLRIVKQHAAGRSREVLEAQRIGAKQLLDVRHIARVPQQLPPQRRVRYQLQTRIEHGRSRCGGR